MPVQWDAFAIKPACAPYLHLERLSETTTGNLCVDFNTRKV